MNPGASDLWYDGVDQDCAGDSDYDQDGDGGDSDQHGGETATTSTQRSSTTRVNWHKMAKMTTATFWWTRTT